MRALVAAAVIAVPGVALAGEGYEVKVTDRVEVEIGAEAAPSLTIAPAPDHSISRQGPLLITLEVTPAEGLTLRKHRYRRGDAADERAEAPRFDLRLRAATAGDYRVAIELDFWVCRRWSCRPISETRLITVSVVAPAPPADAGTEPAAVNR
jgi:hypothetical protein